MKCVYNDGHNYYVEREPIVVIGKFRNFFSVCHRELIIFGENVFRVYRRENDKIERIRNEKLHSILYYGIVLSLAISQFNAIKRH